MAGNSDGEKRRVILSIVWRSAGCFRFRESVLCCLSWSRFGQHMPWRFDCLPPCLIPHTSYSGACDLEPNSKQTSPANEVPPNKRCSVTFFVVILPLCYKDADFTHECEIQCSVSLLPSTMLTAPQTLRIFGTTLQVERKHRDMLAKFQQIFPFRCPDLRNILSLQICYQWRNMSEAQGSGCHCNIVAIEGLK